MEVFGVGLGVKQVFVLGYSTVRFCTIIVRTFNLCLFATVSYEVSRTLKQSIS